MGFIQVFKDEVLSKFTPMEDAISLGKQDEEIAALPPLPRDISQMVKAVGKHIWVCPHTKRMATSLYAANQAVTGEGYDPRLYRRWVLAKRKTQCPSMYRTQTNPATKAPFINGSAQGTCVQPIDTYINNVMSRNDRKAFEQELREYDDEHL